MELDNTLMSNNQYVNELCMEILQMAIRTHPKLTIQNILNVLNTNTKFSEDSIDTLHIWEKNLQKMPK